MAVILLGFVLWLHAALLRDGGALGAPRTDVLRAVWGLDLAWSALPQLPIWTDHVGFPVGVKVVTLPLVTNSLGAPLRLFLDPVAAYDVWILGVLWLSSVAAAWLGQRVSGSAAAGLFTGAMVLAQPVTFLALTDGTPEFVAFWAVPAALAALHAGKDEPFWAFLGGTLLTVIAMDSPYNAVFAAPFVPLALLGMRRRCWPWLLGPLLWGAGLLAFLYYGLPLKAPDENLAGNAVLLRVWEQWQGGIMVRAWDYTLGVGFMVNAAVLAGLALALPRPVRALPWVLIAVLCFAWSLAAVPDNTTWLAQKWGDQGKSLGEAISWFNTHLVPPVVRFPRRWLLPAALALGVAGALGITRLPWGWARLVVAGGVGGFLVVKATEVTGYRANLPHFDPPHPSFTDFVADHYHDGAVLFVPRVRGARQRTARDELPVFASLGADLASADLLWLGVLCERPTVYAPDGLRTLTYRYRPSEDLGRLLHDLDDLATPQTTGSPIPGSATMEPERRAKAAEAFVRQGLGFVVIDEAIMGEEGTRLAKLPFEGVLLEERHFDDGTGVTVLVVGAKD